MTAHTHGDGVQLSLIGPNIGACVGIASTEAASVGREAHGATDTAERSAPPSTAHEHHAQRSDAGKRSAPGFAERIGKTQNGETTQKRTRPVRSHAEVPRSPLLTGEWLPASAVVALIAGRYGVTREQARALLDHLYTTGRAERSYTGDGRDGPPVEQVRRADR